MFGEGGGKLLHLLVFVVIFLLYFIVVVVVCYIYMRGSQRVLWEPRERHLTRPGVSGNTSQKR